jgi:hypothetical protein
MRRGLVAGVGVIAVLVVMGPVFWQLAFPGSCPYPEVLHGWCPICWCGAP